MVAHGTIAFDTLTTSDQVKTSTEKSLDTSYVYNGSSKCWVNLIGTGTAAINDSFNTSGITDNGTGEYTISIANDFSAVNYSLTTGVRGVSGTSQAIAVIDIDTPPLVGAFKVTTKQSGSAQNAMDCPLINCTTHGDLA